MKKRIANHITAKLNAKQKTELITLQAMSDEEIDTNDIPEISDWKNSKRGINALREYIGKHT